MSYLEDNGTFTFDGVNSADYGVWITGANTYSAPPRRFEEITIPGKNGVLTLDQRAFEDIEQTYPAFISRNFPSNIEGIRNQLLSRSGKKVLTDSYHPDEFYLAKFMQGVDVEVGSRAIAGRFDLVFKRDPRRFLKSGETPITIGEWGETTEHSGSIATFEAVDSDAVKSLKVALEPEQDLNGYDAPWPAGGGKNKLNSGFCLSRTVKGLKTVVNADGSITLTGTADGAARYWNSSDNLGLVLPAGTYTLSPSNLKLEKHGGGTVAETFTLSAETTFENVYWAGFAIGEVVNMVVYPQLESGSIATAYSPYSNICPISGWDSVNVTRTGINIWDEEWEVGAYNPNTGEKDSNRNAWRNKNIISIKPSTPYYIYTNSSKSAGARVFWYDENGDYISFSYGFNSVKTSPSNAYYCKFRVENAHTDEDKVSINYPSTDTAYHAYNGQTYPTTLPQTVYGGSLDVVSGVLTIDRAIVDMGTLTWQYQSAVGHERFRGIGVGDVILKPSASSVVADILCSAYKAITSDATHNHSMGYGIGVTSTDGSVYVYDTTYTDAATFKAAMSGVQLCYALATPQTIQLTPQQVALLVGTNNIWSDSGDVTVEVGTNPNMLINPTLFASKPLIRVYGHGNLTVGHDIITVADDFPYVDIDSEIMDCYYGTANANASVSFSGNDFPELPSGNTGVTYDSTITKVEITPRWWRL